MLPEERRQQIVQLINGHGSVYVPELSKMFKVTEETIRRDLEKLEYENLLKRTYGGAVAIQPDDELSFNIRKQQSTTEKNRIAAKGASLVRPGDTVFLDASTTCLSLARSLLNFRDITVITNSARVVFDLAKNQNITVISTGGLLRAHSLSFVGPVAISTISKYYADRAFVSCKGISLDFGATDSNEWEIEVKRAIVQRAKQCVILADHTKFDHVGLATFASLDDITTVITNTELDEDAQRKYSERGLQVLLA